MFGLFRLLGFRFCPRLADIGGTRFWRMAGRVSKGPSARVPFLILLKTFQRLGYFTALREVPRCIVEHIANDQGMMFVPDNMEEYDESGTRPRHVPIIRIFA